MRHGNRDRAARLTRMAALATLFGALDPAAGGDWGQYRGPDRSGVSAETGLLRAWPEGGPRVLWRAPLGGGYSGISIVGDQAFTMYSRDDAEFVACFEAATGKEVWRVRVDAVRRDDQGDGPRSTPTVDGGMVFALGAQGRLLALRAANGREIWSKDLPAEFGARIPRWGVSTSPLVEGDLVVVDAGGRPGSAVVALERRTGAVRWTAHDDRPGYSAPVAVTFDGVRQILSFGGTGLVSVNAADGAVLWSVPWTTSYDVNAAMPLLVPPDKFFISSGYDKGAGLFRVRRTDSTWTVDNVWRSRVMKNHFNSSVLHEGHLYGFDNAMLKCIVADTGEEKWAQRGFSKGSLLLADGHLIVLGEAGQLALVEATPESYREKALGQILAGRTWTMPSLAGGRLYLRNPEEMVAVDIRR